MTTSIAELSDWMNVPAEHENLEFKAATASGGIHGDRIFKYCVAISNEGGGKLILGVSDERPRKVVGTRAAIDPAGMQKKILDTLHFLVRVEELMHRDGRVVIFHIPSRDQGTARQFEGAYWMRSGEELMPMTPERLKEIFEEGKPDWLEGYSLTGLNAEEVVELLDVQRFFSLLGISYPSEREGVIGRLVNERLVDSSESGLSIRRLGALLLAKRLQDFPDVARKAPRVVVYIGASKIETKADETGAKGYAVGFQRLVKYVMSQLPQNEGIVDALRKEVKLLPEIVIRELAANALIHQDFGEEGTGMMIEIYDNRVEISSPGEPIVPVDRFIDGYQSRNERLANLMRRFGVCEEKAAGLIRSFKPPKCSNYPPQISALDFTEPKRSFMAPKLLRIWIAMIEFGLAINIAR